MDKTQDAKYQILFRDQESSIGDTWLAVLLEGWESPAAERHILTWGTKEVTPGGNVRWKSGMTQVELLPSTDTADNIHVAIERFNELRWGWANDQD